MLDSVTNYANNVLNDKIIAGRYVKLACKRHIDDLKRQEMMIFRIYLTLTKLIE